jgi:tetratricopeptide (TPR) repeat protein
MFTILLRCEKSKSRTGNFVTKRLIGLSSIFIVCFEILDYDHLGCYVCDCVPDRGKDDLPSRRIMMYLPNFRRIMMYLLVAGALCSTSSCLSPLDFSFEQYMGASVSSSEQVVEQAILKEMGYDAYGSGSTHLLAPSVADYPFTAGQLPVFDPIPIEFDVPTLHEQELLQQARDEVVQDRSVSSDPFQFVTRSLTRDTLLAYARQKYEEALLVMDSESAGELNRLIPFQPDFSGAHGDSKKARELAQPTALAVLYGDEQPFKVALAAAVLTLDPDDPLTVNNFASAIIPTKDPEAVLAQQAADIFRYAYTLSLYQGQGTADSLIILVNLGNVLLDLQQTEHAKSAFILALDTDPSYWDAAVGLASCYWAEGMRLKARAVLEDAQLARPALFAMQATCGKAIEELGEVIDIPIDAPEAVHEQAITAVAEIPIVTAADFISSMDQNTRNTLRGFVEYLSPIGSYQTPKITQVTAYGSLQAMRQPHGFAALSDFTESVALFATKTAASQAQQIMNQTGDMGLQVDITGIDLADLEAHPEHYAQYEGGQATVSGVDNVYAYAADMEQQARQAELDLANNRTASSLQLATELDPSFVIFQLNPAEYVDPANVLIQRYNMMLYQIKYNTYGKYLFSLSHKAFTTVQAIIQQAGMRLSGLEELFGECNDECEDAVKQWNQICSSYWNQATSYASVQYVKKIAPQAEAFYHDVFRHVALISAPEVRDRKDRELRATIDQAVAMGLEAVLMAYGAFDYYPVQEACCQDRTRIDEIEEVETQRVAKNRGEKKRFDSGDIPPSSPLFKKLDSYGTDLDIPFVPISGRISAAREDLKIKFDMPIGGGPALDYRYTKNKFTGQSMHDGSVSYKFSGKSGGATLEGRLSLSGKIGFNGDGSVSDYGFGVSGDATASYKGGSVTVSGGTTIGPEGMSFTGDASGSFTAQLPGAEAVEVQVAVQRDGSLTIDPQIAFDPIGDLIGEAAESAMQESDSQTRATDKHQDKKVFSGKFVL